MTEGIEATTDQTFCLYCQEDFKTPLELAQHLVDQHPSTYAEQNLTRQTPEPERKISEDELEDHFNAERGLTE